MRSAAFLVAQLLLLWRGAAGDDLKHKVMKSGCHMVLGVEKCTNWFFPTPRPTPIPTPQPTPQLVVYDPYATVGSRVPQTTRILSRGARRMRLASPAPRSRAAYYHGELNRAAELARARASARANRFRSGSYYY